MNNNATTPPTTRSNNIANQPLATQQPTTTEKIKDSVKQAVNKAQNVLTGSHTKTMTPPSSNDAAHVLNDSNNIDSHNHRHHEKSNVSAAYETSKHAAENKAAGNVAGVREANEAFDRKRNEGITGKAASAAGNVVGKVEGTAERVTGFSNDVGVRTDKHRQDLSNDILGTTDKNRHGLNNDVLGTTGHKHGMNCAAGHQQESHLNQQIDAPWQQLDAVPPKQQQQQQKLGGQISGNSAYENTERPVNVTGNSAFDNTRPGNQSKLGSNLVPPSKDSATSRVDDARRF
ncbi:hypothetical protein GGF42_001820 [Coemansia sp. RSA 2424]|nr:hypothetical protein GGF42_001820 [Coemansia sp. RSA 2424]